MERVQFQQEEMLSELKDLVLKGLFTLKESKQVMKKRTAFETALVRRVAKKADFLRYAAYEMGLEQLRRKRLERMNMPPSPPSISDYALVRRQFHIFERALKKFKSDVGLWVQYIQVAKREGARALVGRISARALQLHPNAPALYILAASHELAHLSPSAARTLLQRGIRLNPDSVDMWREYLRMELGFVESLRRRWDVLGIDPSAKGKQVASEEDTEERDQLEMIDVPTTTDVHSDDAATARRQVMNGAIVKSVITSATTALPKIPLFVALQDVITGYPSLPSLRESLLNHLHARLRLTQPDNPHAIKLIVSNRYLRGSPSELGESLVDALKSANEELSQGVRDHGTREDYCQVYAEFISEWYHKAIDESLKVYLVASLRSLIHRHAHNSPSLLATHLQLLLLPLDDSGPAPNIKVVDTARKYTTKAPTSASVWLARLAIEESLLVLRQLPDGKEKVQLTWAEARRSVRGDGVDKVWVWGLENDNLEDDETTRLAVHESLLKESMRDSSLMSVHKLLLQSYVLTVYKRPKHGDRSDQGGEGYRMGVVRHIAADYLMSAHGWKQMFALETELGEESSGAALKQIYEIWRKSDDAEASLTWARWLLEAGKGLEAKEIVVGTRSRLVGETRTVFEKRWMEDM